MLLNKNAVRRLMIEQNMTQNALAAKAGISRATLSSYLHGRSSQQPQTFLKIAAALNIDVSDILIDE